MPDWRRRRQHPGTPGTTGTREHRGPGAGPQQPSRIGARPRWQVERLRDEAEQWYEEYQRENRNGERWDTEWPRGIADAARWALGECVNAPVTKAFTGQDVVPDVPTMRAEDYKADWAIRHPSEADVSSSSWANGVQHTLMWITGDTAESPIGFDQD